jgi:hypothetical protein
MIVGTNDGHLDHDKDGQKNLFEYAFGSDPCDPLDKALPQVTMDGSGYASLSYFQAITDGSLIYIPEVTDPGPSPVWASDFIDQTLSGSPQNKVWRDNPSGGGSPPKIRFFRVRVEPSS